MNELLELCGFERKEIEKELPRIKKAFDRIGVTSLDVEHSKQRLAKYYDIELKGVRMILGVYLRALIDLVLARDEGKKKLIYGGVGPGFETLGSVIITKTRDVYAGYPDHLFRAVFTAIFEKLVPVLEKAESLWLKRGFVVHCAEVKGRVGLLSSGLIPQPDLMITSGCMCETNPKAYDLAHEILGTPIYYFEICRDMLSGNLSDFKRATVMGARALRQLAGRLQEEVGLEITDEDVKEVLDARGKLSSAITRVRNLIENSDPLVLSAAHDVLIHYLGKIVLTVDELQGAPLDAINTLYDELKERADKGIGVLEKGAPRVFALMPPSSGGPEFEHLVNEVGIALIAAETGFNMPDGSRRPPIGEVNDPFERMFSYVYASGSLNTRDRAATVIAACKQLSVEGVIGRYHVGCRTVAGDALIMKSAITQQLGIPIMLLEWENFDPRVHQQELFKRSMERFKLTMRPM
jgi:benzoyl-CoA reductase/2-hydroxyglutaryl-CoA dehydratase subunit BcrC/BadD/HgdB